jgi:hypothetical protein
MTFVWPCSNLGIAHPTGEGAAPAQSEVFARLGRYTLEDRPYSWMKGQFSFSAHQVETRVSLFQELGLLYSKTGQDRLQLTSIGTQLLNLIDATDEFRPREAAQATALIAWALSNIQIQRPLSRGSPGLTAAERNACDIRPCAAAWSMMLDLDGVLYMHEFLGPVRELQRVADYDACVAQIRQARINGEVFVQPDQWAAGAPLMNPSIYWKSRISVAGQLLEYDTGQQRFGFAPGGENLLLALIDSQADQSLEDDTAFLEAAEWEDVESYFRAAGRQCPAEVAGTFAEVPEPAPPAANENAPPETPLASSPEGRRKYRMQAFTERNSSLSREAKRLNAEAHNGRVTCESCDFSHLDAALFDAHHEHPLVGGVRQSQVADLKILCPTCHRRAHRTDNPLTPLTIQQLRAWIAAGRP